MYSLRMDTAQVLLLALACISMSDAVPITLNTCVNSDSQVCSYFFDVLERAFTSDRNIIYALQRVFYPVRDRSPILLDVEATVNVLQVPDSPCSDEEFNRPLASLGDVMCDTTCTAVSWEWTHQWSRSIINFVIEKEDLGLLQDVNIVAFATALFSHFDNSIFTGEELDPNNITSVQSELVEFNIQIPSLHCIPPDSVMQEAWEDILPWVSWQKVYNNACVHNI